MIVCVDIGNSYIKMALVDAGRVRRARVIESRASSAELERTLRLLVRGRVTRGIIASVLPQRT
ncbi:MAG TPA: type III pantothenate kinase, partial [Candidatus Krumholzibacteria bacterium]|nr:type III pantothenate kinase [Candidatus Krumholzibacteria bacterium]